MQYEQTELVIRLHGAGPDERDQLRNYLAVEAPKYGLKLETESSSDVLGVMDYETVLVVCTVIQTGAKVIETIHKILQPWLDERRKNRADTQKPPIEAEVVDEERNVTTVKQPEETELSDTV